jgi:hypothetical protein
MPQPLDVPGPVPMMTSMRLRILIGTLILIGGLSIYVLLVMVTALAFLPEHWAAEIGFYAVAGTLWVWPAAWLTRWMQRAAPFRPPSR